MTSSLNTLLERHVHFSKFLIVGSLNTALDFALYFIFANLLKVQPVIASIISTSVTMYISFHLNHHYVFQSSKKRRHTAIQFFLVTAFNVWLVQSSVIALTIHLTRNWLFFDGHMWTLNMLAKLCGVAVSFILNFLMYRYIFQNKEMKGQPIL